MVSPGPRPALVVGHAVLAVQRVRRAPSHRVIVHGRGAHARRILAAGSLVVDLSGRLDPAKKQNVIIRPSKEGTVRSCAENLVTILPYSVSSL